MKRTTLLLTLTLLAAGTATVLAQQGRLSVANQATDGFLVTAPAAGGQQRVLGLCPEGKAAEANPSLQWWFDAMEQALAAAGSPARAPLPADLGLPEAVEPLVATRWGQAEPFNNLCPVGADGSRCLTGCVATSTAQVMNYHKLPIRGQGQGSVCYPYDDPAGTVVKAAFGATWYDWDHMLDRYKEGEYTAEEAAAVAQLMLHAGVSASMMYGTEAEGGSGANSTTAWIGLMRNMGFSQVSYHERTDYSEEDWMRMVYEQLALHGPIVYDGNDQRGGHSFIIDGYRSDGLVHVNWGYEGNGDGYYDIATLRPSFSVGGYATGQGMMLVVPDEAEDRNATLDLSGLSLTNGLLPAKAAYGHPYATHVILPAGITQWGDGALGGCPALRTVELPESEGRQFVVVDDYLICSPDTTELIAVLSPVAGRVDVPATITTIHPNAFDACVGIDTLTLPAQLSAIGGEALRQCAGLHQLRVRAKTPPTLKGYDTFLGIWFDDCQLSVPSGTKNTYARRAQWKDFTEVDEFGTTIRANNAVRRQGEPNPEFGYSLAGEPVSGTPHLYTDATVDSPPGVYTIFVEAGTISSPDVEYVNGRLIVEEADGIITTTAQEARPAALYNLHGQRLSHPLRGIVIVNGKKKLSPLR